MAGVALFGAVGCSGDKNTSQNKPLRVGWFLWPGWYPVVLAKELGLFEKRGAHVEPILYESYTKIIPDFAAGKLDAAFGGLYELLKSNIPDIKIVLVTDNSDGAEGLIVTKDIKTPADLKGKRIGIQGALSGSEFLITTLLRKNGLSRNDLTLVDVDPELVLEEMARSIQGGYTWEPFISRAVAQGHRLLFSTAETPGMIPDVVAFHQAAVQDRSDAVQAFVAAWFDALAYWKAHPDNANKIIAKALGLKPDEISLQGCKLFNREDNLKAFSPGETMQSLYYTGKLQTDFFISMGDVSTVPDLEKRLEPRFVKASTVLP